MGGGYSFKNTFIHFEEADSKENADPRIVQSMPAGKFAEGLHEEMAAAARKAKIVQRPRALCEQTLESEAVADMVFPQTPDADAARWQAVPLQATSGPSSLEYLPSSEAAAAWLPAPPTGAPTIVTAAPVATSSPWWTAASPTTSAPSPMIWQPMTTVVVTGLTNQPAFNGLQGQISSFDVETGRYNVLLELGAGKQRMAKLKLENLILPVQPVTGSSGVAPSVLPGAGSQTKPKLMLDELVV